MKETKMRAYLELNKERISKSICQSCFQNTLEIILNKKELTKVAKCQVKNKYCKD